MLQEHVYTDLRSAARSGPSPMLTEDGSARLDGVLMTVLLGTALSEIQRYYGQLAWDYHHIRLLRPWASRNNCACVAQG
ncbi:hypothetical protein HPB50_009401 [Hyalomma asiaticum]|uniref:Uncharacterized protein n=1 Tax=Hyalomma asiaticum TaxID=266040 RepID=A0ACB7SC96_HYAAI|nr:hypothetical protein HPB50_009401 [Hyalomma asiaticum]